MRAFADALDSVPMALAENSGLSPIETLASIKSRQVKEKNSRLGVDCMQSGSNGKHTETLHQSRLCPLFADGFARYARKLRHRSFDWQTPATPTRHTALPYGPQDQQCHHSRKR